MEWDGERETMYACTCGATFPPTLNGAWAAKEHADEHGHPLVEPHESLVRRAAAATLA